MKYDALVVGSGIGGMESALKLGDMGYKVLVVEKQASVGGKMILLSKVFPTLDCASCISTPKMAATIHHPNIDVLTYAEVDGIRATATAATTPASARSRSSSTRSPAPAVASARWPATWPCPTSSTPTWCRAARPTSPSRRRCPRRRSSSRAGVSPCTYECPAGIKAHGYVARVRSGEYDQAFDLVLETTPLVGSPRARLLRALRGAVHARRARGSAADPPPQALHRRPALRPGRA